MDRGIPATVASVCDPNYCCCQHLKTVAGMPVKSHEAAAGLRIPPCMSMAPTPRWQKELCEGVAAVAALR